MGRDGKVRQRERGPGGTQCVFLESERYLQHKKGARENTHTYCKHTLHTHILYTHVVQTYCTHSLHTLTHCTHSLHTHTYTVHTHIPCTHTYTVHTHTHPRRAGQLLRGRRGGRSWGERNPGLPEPRAPRGGLPPTRNPGWRGLRRRCLGTEEL